VKTIGKLALSGLVTVLPVAVTLYVLWWLCSGAEAFLGGMLRRVLPEGLYVPGAGLLVGVVLLVGVGLLMHAVVARRLSALFDRLVDRIPLVKTVYGAVGDLLSFFSKHTEREVKQVVLVPIEGTAFRVLGLVTRAEVSELDPGVEGDPVAAVYLPMSYGVGGYTVLVRRSALTAVSMTVEEALRFAITAGAPSRKRTGGPDAEGRPA
jgi:uncharacterized membrane protein